MNHRTPGRYSCELPKPPPAKAPPPPVPVPKLNSVKFAREYLGSRLTEKGGAFWLDKVPVNFTTVMRAANATAITLGHPQLDYCPAWIVKA